MKTYEIIAQIFGIIGFLLSVYCFQEKSNKSFFIKQGLSGLMFFLNYIMIGAVAAALFNLTNLIRGLVLSRGGKKVRSVVFIELLYVVCFVFSLTLVIDKPFQILLSTLTYSTVAIMTVFMYIGNGRNIRYVHLFYSSPVWIVYNIFNFTIGGILCEIFTMTSIVISLIRFRKDGFENQ